jgi:hypothetical protein
MPYSHDSQAVCGNPISTITADWHYQRGSGERQCTKGSLLVTHSEWLNAEP